MNQFIDYINKHTVDEVVAVIVNNKRDRKKADQSLRDCRTEFQIKTQQIQNRLKESTEEESEEDHL